MGLALDISKEHSQQVFTHKRLDGTLAIEYIFGSIRFGKKSSQKSWQIMRFIEFEQSGAFLRPRGDRC